MITFLRGSHLTHAQTSMVHKTEYSSIEICHNPKLKHHLIYQLSYSTMNTELAHFVLEHTHLQGRQVIFRRRKILQGLNSHGTNE